MRKTMGWISGALAIALAIGVLGMTTVSSAQVRQRVVIIQRVPVIDPFFGYPYLYAYPPGFVGTYYGYVKIKTHGHERDQLYVDGGYADTLKKSKTFAMRPGTHDIELRDSSGHKLLQERVAVLIGKTTKVDVPS